MYTDTKFPKRDSAIGIIAFILIAIVIISTETMTEIAANHAAKSTAKSTANDEENAFKINAFMAVLLKFDKYPVQYHADRRIWSCTIHNYSYQISISPNESLIGIAGYGSCQPLIAKTPHELKQCIVAYSRNRKR